MQITPLPWDSNHFNIKIGSLFVNNLSETDYNTVQRNFENFDLVYIFSNTHSDKINKPLNTKVLFQNSLNKLKNIDCDNIRTLDRTHFKEVLELSLVAGHFSRFVLDKKIPNKDFESLYKKWVEKSFSDDHIVFGYCENGKVEGMISLQLSSQKSIANIELIGVTPNAQGKQIGTKLVSACVKHIKENSNIQFLSVYTQLENTTACQFYEKCGFTQQNQINIHHIWAK